MLNTPLQRPKPQVVMTVGAALGCQEKEGHMNDASVPLRRRLLTGRACAIGGGMATGAIQKCQSVKKPDSEHVKGVCAKLKSHAR